jgi:hypothetical protein
MAPRPCVCCMKNMFVLDKVTGKVVGPAVCVLKRHRAKHCTRYAEGNKRCIPLPASLVARALALARMRWTREAVHQTLEFWFKIYKALQCSCLINARVVSKQVAPKASVLCRDLHMGSINLALAGCRIGAYMFKRCKLLVVPISDLQSSN